MGDILQELLFRDNTIHVNHFEHHPNNQVQMTALRYLFHQILLIPARQGMNLHQEHCCYTPQILHRQEVFHHRQLSLYLHELSSLMGLRYLFLVQKFLTLLLCFCLLDIIFYNLLYQTLINNLFYFLH